jgi:cell migration-inducing and hyaluronan-binding protein
VENTTFRNFQDNATRKSGALSYLLFTSFPTSSDNSVEKVKLVNAKPAYFPPIERKWGNDNGGSAGWRTAAFKDKDGSLTGTPNDYVVNNIGLLGAFDGCEVKPTWNAAVCKGDIGRVNVGGGGGGFGGGGPPGAGPGAGAPRGARGAGPGAVGGPGAPGAPGAATRAAPAPGAVGPGPGAGPAAGPGGAPGAGAPRGPGAGPGAGGFGGFGGGRGGAAAGPPQPPVVLSRKGKDFTVNGETNVMANTELKVATERESLNLSISQLDAGSWVIFELPGFATAASGAPQDSLDAVRKASVTSYYKAGDALWVKVVSTGEGARLAGPGAGGTSVEVNR